jgi:hypothetical protein
MDESLLEIRDHQGQGYQPLVDHGDWRVAILRFEDGLMPGYHTSMERHLETDEVFVLTKGQGTLVLGGNTSQINALTVQAMEIGKIYNIKKNAWHTLALSPDGSVVIVENRNTTVHNSEYRELSEEQRQWIADAVRAQDPTGV